MFRQTTAGGYLAITEAGGVVGCHRAFIIGIIIINQRHPFNGVVGLVKLLEDIQYRVRKMDADAGKPTADLEVNE